MRKFYSGVVKCQKVILVLFFVAAVVCFFLSNLVSVNYDMNDYLPEDSPSTVSLELMEAEFDGGIPNARVMISDVTIPKAMQYKEKLENVDGVTEVTWLDDAIDIKIPLVMQDSKTIETYYKDNVALFSVTIKEEKQLEAVDDIRAIIGEENAMSGSAVSTALATTSTVQEISRITVIAVAFVLFVLILTTDSWMEPFVVLIGLGIAIAINMGTNLIFGEISFVTNAAGTILQLAVSLDYSVFLIHRYTECLEQNHDPKGAMVDALCKSTMSILSSGLTTVIGFFALIFMRFGIGPDLGLSLAKGISISLVTVFLFMPTLILATHKWMVKTKHRPFLPEFKKFGKVVTKVMIPSVCLFVLIVVPAYKASNANTYYYGSSHLFGTDTQLGRDIEKIENVFGKSDTYVLMVPRDNMVMEKQLSDALHTLPEVTGIISYVDMAGTEIPLEYLDESTLSQLISDKYSRMVISVDADYEGEDTFALVKEIREIAEKYYPGNNYLAGEGVSTYDLMDTITKDMVKVNLIAIGAVFLVLLLMMRTIALPIILVLSIEAAIWINLSFPYFMDATIFYIAYLIISSVQLGATVDYAILLTDRYREFRQSLPKKEAIVETLSAVTVSILTSGSVLAVVGFLLGSMSSHRLLAQLGIFIGRGALCSLGVVLFVLPGLLYLFDKMVTGQKKSVHKNFKKEKSYAEMVPPVDEQK